MRVKSVVLAMAAGLALCASAVFGPQAQAKPQVPQGSYLATCRNANIYQNTDLLAMCPNNQGQLAVVKLSNYALCGGDIANVNGQLVCRGGGGGGYRPPPPPPQNRRYPPGSYLQSCQNARVNNGWLQASCADVRGYWHNTQIPLNQCRGDIGNANGRLICG